MVLWTLRQEIYCFCHVFKYTKILLSVTNLWLFAVHILYWKMFCSSGNSKPSGESCLWVFFKASNRIHSAEKAKKCLSNTQEHGEARNATWWQNIKIICSRSLAARHNPTCPARQQAVKHPATLTCKNIFISSPVAKNRSFFIEASKTVWNMYWQSHRGEVQARTAQQPYFRPLPFALGFKVRKHTLPQSSTLPLESLSQASAKEAWCWFSESTCCFSWSSTAWACMGHNMDSIRTALPLLRSLFLSAAWPTNTTLTVTRRKPPAPSSRFHNFWAKRSQTWIRWHTTRKRNLLLLLHTCAAFMVFTCSRHTKQKTA